MSVRTYGNELGAIVIIKMFSSFCCFLTDCRASVTTISAVAIIPLTVTAGVAVDLGRVMTTKTTLQTALDAAVMSGVQVDQAKRNAYATAMFHAQVKEKGFSANAPVFKTNTDGSFTGSVSSSVPTTLMKLAGRDKVDLDIKATATAPKNDDSCILSLGQGMTPAEDSMTFNGAPNVNLSSCTLRSNTSMKCNGHDGNSPASYAVGAATSCSNPYGGSAAIPDVHAPLAANINPQCGLDTYNLTWTVGSSPPSSPQMITIVSGAVTEYHVCGTLTLKGTGTLLGTASADSLLVIENGDLILDKDADIELVRTTIILTGSTGSHSIIFPQGKGKSATLRITPGSAVANPWRGTGIYQDPALTTNIDIDWGPGANLYADGVLYFPKADVTISGNANSNSGNCSKLVVSTVTINGAVALGQSTAGCAAIGLQQYKQASYMLQ